MKKGTKKIIAGVVITSIIATFGTYKAFKLIEARDRAYRLIQIHTSNEYPNHSENIVAHRGFSSLETDNSYESVALALDCDCVDMIEIDVRMTQDGVLVLHHDSMLSFEDLPVRIEDLNFEETDLQRLTRQYPNFNVENYLSDDTLFLLDRFFQKDYDDEELITFRDFVNWYSFEKPIIIDVKCNGVNERFENSLSRLLKGHEDMVYIQCYSYDFLKSMQGNYPNFKYLLLVRMNKEVPLMDDKSFDGYTVRSGLLKKIKVDQDKLYFLYTVNSSKKYFSILNNPNYNDNMYFITDVPDYDCALREAVELGKKNSYGKRKVKKLLEN